VTHLLADGHAPLGMAVGPALRLGHDDVHTVQLDAPVDGLWRAGDAGVFVVSERRLQRFDPTGAPLGAVAVPSDVERVVGPDPGGSVWVTGADGSTWRWHDRGLEAATVPAGVWSPTGSHRWVDGQQLVGRDGSARPLGRRLGAGIAWSADGRSLIGFDGDEESWPDPLVRLDLGTGQASEAPGVPYRHGGLYAVSPDGTEVAWLSDGVVGRAGTGPEAVPRRPSQPIFQWQLESSGGASAVVTWRMEDDRPWLYRVGGEAVPLAVPAAIPPKPERMWRQSLPGVAIEPGERWVALRFGAGPLAVIDAGTGALRWEASADVASVVGPHVAFDVVYPEQSATPGWACSDGQQAPHPFASPDGTLVLAAGRVGDATSPQHVVHAWDAGTGAVRHRFVFDAPTEVLGFRHDGRVVVRSARTVFALSVATPMGEPEVVADRVEEASVHAGQVLTSGSYTW
jgi:hypothetical protein